MPIRAGAGRAGARSSASWLTAGFSRRERVRIAALPGRRLAAGTAAIEPQRIQNRTQLPERNRRDAGRPEVHAGACLRIEHPRRDHLALYVRQTANEDGFTATTPEADHLVKLKLAGRHQVDNAVTALRAAEVWLGLKPEENAERHITMLGALRQTTWPGRLQKVAESPELWIDVGHTPCALEAVTRTFQEFTPREKTLVVFVSERCSSASW